MKIISITLSLLLVMVAGGNGQTADQVKKTDFVIVDGGLRRQFELALDETDEKQPDGKSRPVKAARSEGLGEVRQKALAKEKENGRQQNLVLYEKGKPRSEATRRVETRKVLVKVAEGFDENTAAAKFGAVNIEKPPYAPGHVLFTFKEPGESLTKAEEIKAHPGVFSAEPMLAKQQNRRLIPNDTLFSYNLSNAGYQWHLRNTGQSPGTAGIDVNIIDVWDTHLGTGVRIGIVDDGLEVTHPDLSPNADTVNDHDWNDSTPNDPTGNPSSDTHGTACAGVAGARGNNGAGVSGAAPNATLVGLRLIAGNVSDAQEAEALTWGNDIIQLYSNSWGPADDGANLVDAGPLVKQAFANGAATGRGGRGSIWLWAAGNGGDVGDNSNYDGYANSIYTISVGALNDTGTRSAYSEPGANVVICAPSNDSTGTHRGITTTTTNSGYTYSFGGTSSATPLAAGVVALLLQSNPNLGWRDVQEILIRSATKVNPTHADWINNGAGYHFNHNYGGGLINAQAAITMAEGWTNLGPQVTQQVAQTGLSVAIPDGNTTGTTRTFTIPGSVLMRVEHATVKVTATHGRRGDLDITLTSPSGTVSKLFTAHGDSNLDLDWTFSTVRSWGENAAGNWTLKIADLVGGTPGTLTSATLTLYGANLAPPTSPPVINSPLTKSGNVEAPFSYQITATQNPQSFSAAPLPPGLSLSASGLISGTPTQEGTFNVTLGATNSLGAGNATLVVTIGPRIPTPPVITSMLAVSAVLNVPFNYQISATNSPTTFGASNLPPGLVVNMSTGVISGTPSAIGGYNVSINATNADGQDTETLVITINSAASALAQALDAPQLIFTTGGDAAWATPASLTHDGVDAAQSGAIGNSQQTWLETTVVGPAFISFWFRLESEPDYDFFRFFIDGVSQWESSGLHEWRRLGFFIPAGVHAARWSYTKDDIYIGGADRLWVDQVVVHDEQVFLADVVDNPNLTWRQSGSGSWVMQDRRQIDAVDAFISPFFLDHGRSSAIETVVMGPGTVSFWWTVSSEPGFDFFRFEMDDEIYAEISGFASGGNNIPWDQETYSIPAGLHTLRWRYIKNEVTSQGLDSAWLDTISYTPQFASGPPYAQWLASHYPAAQLGNGEITGPGVDGDGDFRSNLEEYAFGGSPLIQDFVQPVSVAPAGAEMFFDFTTDASRTDLQITPRLSDDLSSWADDTGEFVSQAGDIIQWRVRVPRSAGRKFVKLRATLTP